MEVLRGGEGYKARLLEGKARTSTPLFFAASAEGSSLRIGVPHGSTAAPSMNGPSFETVTAYAIFFFAGSARDALQRTTSAQSTLIPPQREGAAAAAAGGAGTCRRI